MNTLKNLLILFALITSVVYAQNDTTVANDKQEQEQKPDADSSIDSKDQSTAEIETPDTFDPTEKLSEDIAAEFPVDI